MPKRKRDHESKVLDVQAGCRVCHGTEPHWTAPNALAVAAKHAQITGHRTWAIQTIEVLYGQAPEPIGDPLPGMSVPAAGTTSHHSA